jgi:acyl-CoA synthetase (AMP-forming)/AMP-acid ligase II
LSIAKCGAVVAALNFRYKTGEIVYAINNSGSKLLIFSSEFLPMVDEAKKDFDSAVKLVAMSGDYELTVGGLMEGQSTNEPEVKVSPDSAAALTYTSGTTGLPKGVLLSHRSLLGIYLGLIVEGEMHYGETTLVPIPLFHSAGMHALVGPTLLLGGKAIIMSGSFDPEETLSVVSKHGVSLTLWVPTQLAFLSSHAIKTEHDTSSLKRIWYGSSPMSPTVLEASMNAFSGGFYQFYGQSEIGMATVLRPEDHVNRSQMTGREMFNSEFRVVNLDRSAASVGEVGEIVYSQEAHGMIGYHNMPEATADTIRDGWIHTGDLARVEEDGYITIVDRAKDMIISGAENIYPKEVESAIISHPAVLEVAVFGIPDDIYGEAVCAAVVLNKGHNVSAQEIIDHCATQIASYKKPKCVDFINELPKNAMGKVTKNTLRGPYWAEKKKQI